jgi:hypothetical protein
VHELSRIKIDPDVAHPKTGGGKEDQVTVGEVSFIHWSSDPIELFGATRESDPEAFLVNQADQPGTV